MSEFTEFRKKVQEYFAAQAGAASNEGDSKNIAEYPELLTLVPKQLREQYFAAKNLALKAPLKEMLDFIAIVQRAIHIRNKHWWDFLRDEYAQSSANNFYLAAKENYLDETFLGLEGNATAAEIAKEAAKQVASTSTSQGLTEQEQQASLTSVVEPKREQDSKTVETTAKVVKTTSDVGVVAEDEDSSSAMEDLYNNFSDFILNAIEDDLVQTAAIKVLEVVAKSNLPGPQATVARLVAVVALLAMRGEDTQTLTGPINELSTGINALNLGPNSTNALTNDIAALVDAVKNSGTDNEISRAQNAEDLARTLGVDTWVSNERD